MKKDYLNDLKMLFNFEMDWVRPIVRGKAHAKTEFGAKVHISMVDGYARIERISFEAFNEVGDFFKAVEGLHSLFRLLPENRGGYGAHSKSRTGLLTSSATPFILLARKGGA